jgi:diacylglycerol kinase (ATP)
MRSLACPSWSRCSRVVGPSPSWWPRRRANSRSPPAEAAAAGHTLIVAGGDGTWNRVVNAVNGYAATLGLLPTGSGNDWCRALGLPTEARAAAAVVASGRAASGRSDRGQRPAGLHGRRCRAVRRYEHAHRAVGGARRTHARLVPFPRRAGVPDRRGPLLASPARRAQPVQVSGAGPDGAWEWIGSAHAVFVANQQRLGAGLMLPLAARPDDGVCEIGIVPERGRLSLAWKLQALRSGTPVGEDVLIVRRVRRRRSPRTSRWRSWPTAIRSWWRRGSRCTCAPGR